MYVLHLQKFMSYIYLIHINIDHITFIYLSIYLFIYLSIYLSIKNKTFISKRVIFRYISVSSKPSKTQ